MLHVVSTVDVIVTHAPLIGVANMVHLNVAFKLFVNNPHHHETCNARLRLTMLCYVALLLFITSSDVIGEI